MVFDGSSLTELTGLSYAGTTATNGILPVQHLQQAIHDGAILADQQITAAQLQPASLDLRLGIDAWRVQASFLPGSKMTVADKLANLPCIN